MPDNFLKALWKQRLPTTMQGSLIVGGKDQTLHDLAALADRLHRLSLGISSVEVAPPFAISGEAGCRAHKETRSPHITKTKTNFVSTQNVAQKLTHWIGFTTRWILLVSSVSAGRPEDVPRHAAEARRSRLRKTNAPDIFGARYSEGRLFIVDRSSKLKFLVDRCTDFRFACCVQR